MKPHRSCWAASYSSSDARPGMLQRGAGCPCYVSTMFIVELLVSLVASECVAFEQKACHSGSAGARGIWADLSENRGCGQVSAGGARARTLVLSNRKRVHV